jgi:hypothetical protein
MASAPSPAARLIARVLAPTPRIAAACGASHEALRPCPACRARSIRRRRLVLAAVGFPLRCPACGQRLQVFHAWRDAMTLGAAALFVACLLWAECSRRGVFAEGLNARQWLFFGFLTLVPLSLPGLIALFAQPLVKPHVTWFKYLQPLMIAIGLFIAAELLVWAYV